MAVILIYQHLNLENKINKQNRNRLISREHFNGCQMRGGLEGINKYKLIVTEYSWGYKVQHRQYS